jgi:hypothetical protein
MHARDTTAEAANVQIDAFRGRTGTERVEIAFELSNTVFELTRTGIADRHPEYDEESTNLALFRLLHGDRLFRAVWPGTPLIAP